MKSEMSWAISEAFCTSIPSDAPSITCVVLCPWRRARANAAREKPGSRPYWRAGSVRGICNTR